MRFLALLLLPLAAFAMKLESPAFKDGGIIPIRYTCDGENISPPLRWKGVPKDAKSLVLIVHDPDAPIGDFTHWLVYEIPTDLKGLPPAVPRRPVLENGVKQGVNDFGFVGYGGPCPPPWDGYHRYFFELYALDYKPNLPPAADRKTVEKALKGHVLAKAVLVGRYKRVRYFRFALNPRSGTFLSR
jgi:Raf kinase inhibitor-like YbhB/YbcL family protein